MQNSTLPWIALIARWGSWCGCPYVLGEKYGKERVGLYREDGLVCFENVREPKSGKN